MAEILRPQLAVRIEWNGMKIEGAPDGTLTIFIPPESFRLMTQHGTVGCGQSGRLYSQVIIAPLLSDANAASRPTQTGLAPI